ncbi:hypothetical protein I6N95_05180 [Vagococcus sp. BWB3-3]|uniref:Uncharacterized protein n=1 Tax=Vagococcus allomyrinae TaxID=2794353 RepID=A0A940PCU3_9ENTE|nr:hypothetical protein [Vagococcus allomyrinae]MBP1040403.1 hypothetical protein [Vagococcus allomyrinae]
MNDRKKVSVVSRIVGMLIKYGMSALEVQEILKSAETTYLERSWYTSGKPEATDKISAGTICAGTISVEEINETKEIRKFYHSSDSEFITVVAGTDTCTIVSQSDNGVEIKQLRMLDEELPRYQDGLKY